MRCVAEPLSILLIAIFSFVKYSTAIETDLTIDIDPGKRECFHQYAPPDSSFEVEYQVWKWYSILTGDFTSRIHTTMATGYVFTPFKDRVRDAHY